MRSAKSKHSKLDQHIGEAVFKATGTNYYSDSDLAINLLKALCQPFEDAPARIDQYATTKEVLRLVSDISPMSKAPKRFIETLYQLRPIEKMVDENGNTLLHHLLAQAKPSRDIVKQCILLTSDRTLLSINRAKQSPANIAKRMGHDWAIDLLNEKIPGYSRISNARSHHWYAMANRHTSTVTGPGAESKSTPRP